MAGFVRRFLQVPPLEVITQIEGAVIVDLTPPGPIVGEGTGTVLCVGEFEDGPFTDLDENITEVFSTDDLFQKFGGFGYIHNAVVSQNPSARRHDAAPGFPEFWNGNGFIKLLNLRAQRLMIGRVDTSVGSVSFQPQACIGGVAGPYQLTAGDLLTVTTEIGGPASSTVLAAAVATVAGVAGTFPTLFAGGETIGIRIDGGIQVNVVFSAADQLATDVITRINDTLGFTTAVLNVADIDISGLVAGTDGSVELIDVVPGTLATLGHSVGVTAGTGDVGNINAVTAAEVAGIYNATAGLIAIDTSITVDANGVPRACSDNPGVGTIDMTSTGMAIAMGFTPLATTVDAGTHAAGSIPAGTRVRTAGAVEWVTMQTLDIPEGTVADPEIGPFDVKVRPGLDDGTLAGTAIGTVVVLVDQPDFASLTVTNAAALTAALTEVQMDNAYLAAFQASEDDKKVSREANFLLSARRSDAVVRDGRQNVLDVTANGLQARKFITGDPLQTTVSQILANVALYRSDRVFYTGKGLKVRVPEIAALGVSGGAGFTVDGVITVRPDGPLATLCAILPPENNPGQSTALIDLFFEVDAAGETLTINTYEAFKANGVAVPRLDRQSGMVFQSGVTSSLTPGRLTMARRKMADFIQDTYAELINPFAKQLSRQTRRDSITAVVTEFLASLESEQQPELARIDSFNVNDGTQAGNTPNTLALGVFFIKTEVRTLASLDDIVLLTEIGEGVVITTEIES